MTVPGQFRIVGIAFAVLVALTIIGGSFVTVGPGQRAVAKWDGHLPEVMGSSGVLPMLGNVAVGRATDGKNRE